VRIENPCPSREQAVSDLELLLEAPALVWGVMNVVNAAQDDEDKAEAMGILGWARERWPERFGHMVEKEVGA